MFLLCRWCGIIFSPHHARRPLDRVPLYRRQYECSCSDGAPTLCLRLHPCWAMHPGWVSAALRPSLRRLLLTACCLKFSALHCEYKLQLPGDWTLILFQGCRDGNWSLRVGCCGHHPFLHELARCFSNSSAGCRAGSRLKACYFLLWALHCGYMIPLLGVRMQIVLPGYRDGCCGSHLSNRERARCFSCSPWSQAGSLLSMRMVPLPALGSMFLAPRCECMFRVPGDRTQIVFPGYKGGCCGPLLAHREQARCFSNNWAWCRVGRR